MNIKKDILKLTVIYIYLLIFIAIMLYEYPALLISHYNGKDDILYKQSVEEYIAGEYVNEVEKFNTDKMYFPVAAPDNLDEYIYYVDSYGADRTYGGERSHEGCDIMTVNNVRGELPIVAVCDGVIEKTGWLELGGYRIGLRSDSGVYYYYAHLSAYEAGITEGMTVYAGQVIGYIGDTGYSKVEGTTGNFDVHLHFGIYMNDKNGNEFTVNPFPLLKKIEKSVINYTFKYQ